MKHEMDRDEEQREAEFKNHLFMHAYGSQNPELYQKVFPEEFGQQFEDLEDIDWVIPGSEREALSLFDDLQEEADDLDAASATSYTRRTPLLASSQ